MIENVRQEQNVSSTSYDICMMDADMNEITKKFGPKKSDSLLLASVYHELSQLEWIRGNRNSSKQFMLRSEKVSNCGNFLEFAHAVNTLTGEISEKGKLHNANFCRDVLCPMCSWRKSLKQIAQLSEVLNHTEIKGKYKFLFLTLTVPNVPYERLAEGITHILKSFKKLMKRRKYVRIIQGYYRSLEVTVNERAKTFHHHLHVLLLVPLSYGKKDTMYIKRDDVLKDWQEVTGDKSITQVDIRVVRQAEQYETCNIVSAAIEVAKYAAKVPRRLYKADIIYSLLQGLSGRKTYDYGGILRTIRQSLNQPDIESDDVDLVHINESVPDSVMQFIVMYGWASSGYQIINTRMEGGDTSEYEVC